MRRSSDGRKRILSLQLEDLRENRRLVRNHQLLSNLRFSIWSAPVSELAQIDLLEPCAFR